MNRALSIAVIVIVGGLLAVVAPLSKTARIKQEVQAPIVETPVLSETSHTYHDDMYGVSFTYGSEFVVQQVKEGDQWRNNSSQSGVRLFTLLLPRTFQPSTNFSNAIITVGVSTDKTAVNNCLVAQNGESPLPIPPQGFTGFMLGDAGAGNYYETISYRAIKNGTCIAVEQIVHSTNIENYDPDQGIKVFDSGLVNRTLGAVMDTLSLE